MRNIRNFGFLVVNKGRKASRSVVAGLMLLPALLLMVAGSAMAQADPPTLTSVMTTASTEIKSNIFTVVPIVFGILALMLGIGYGWTKLRKAAKTS